MTYSPVIGDVLRMPSGPTDHMFVVVAIVPEVTDHQTLLLVNFSSIKPDIYHDRACEVAAAEYEELTVDSFIAYSFADIYMVADIVRRVKQGRYVQCRPVPTALLERIKRGVMSSDHTPRKCKNFHLKQQAATSSCSPQQEQVKG